MSDVPYRPLEAWRRIATAVAAALWAVSLRAQTTQTDTDTIYFGKQQEELPKFWLAPLHGSLDLRSTYIRSETSSDGGSGSKQSELFFEETLTLYTHGHIIHPNFVDLRLSITGGLQQDYFSSDVGSDSSNGTVYGWDVSATILRNQSAPLTLYSRRTEAMRDVPFGSTVRSTTTTTGALLNYRTPNSFLTLEAYHQEETESSLGTGDTDFSETRDVLTGNGEVQLSPNQHLNWSFDLQNANYDSGGGDSSERSMAASVGHSVSFGDKNRSSLTSGLSYNQTNGTFESQDFHWTEHLHLQHTDNFQTNYDYSYEQLGYGGNTTDHQSAYVDARHQLYRSLTTLGRLRWDQVDSGDTEVKTYGADLNLNYRKEAPNGILFADANVSHEQQEISGSDTAVVTDQPITFVNLDPVTISQPTVIPGSILIRDATTGRIYSEGIDYTLTPTPQGMEINRVLGGNILPNQPLLLAYDYDPLDASEIITDRFGTGVRYQFTKGPLAGLAPYARFYGQNQDIKEGTALPNDVRDYTVGTYYTLSDLTLRAEREWYDSTLYPYDAWRFEARVTHDLSGATTVAASAMYTDTQYQDPDQHTKSYSLNANVIHRFSTRLDISVYAAYASVDSDVGGTTTGIEEGLQANYHFRDSRVYVKLRNSSLDSDTTEQQFQFFQIGFRRDF